MSPNMETRVSTRPCPSLWRGKRKIKHNEWRKLSQSVENPSHCYESSSASVQIWAQIGRRSSTSGFQEHVTITKCSVFNKLNWKQLQRLDRGKKNLQAQHGTLQFSAAGNSVCTFRVQSRIGFQSFWTMSVCVNLNKPFPKQNPYSF